jgi:two-component system invasion response regulator UvrY
MNTTSPARRAPVARMIRILIVDDHDLFRAGVRSILDHEDGLDVVGECASGEDALEAVRREAPDVVLMDINMPGIGGIEATRQILKLAPSVRVIAVTVLSDDPFPNQLLDAGALGYLSKGCSSDEMIEAIRMVMRGLHYISNDVAQKLTLAGFRSHGESSPLRALTAREMQVMMMITSGQRNQQISDALFLSPKTVSTYRHRLFEKLDVTSDAELTRLAIRHGLIDNA